jgi:hypothetical protein
MAGDVGERLRRQVADRAYHVREYCLIQTEETWHTDVVQRICLGSALPCWDQRRHPACLHALLPQYYAYATVASHLGVLSAHFVGGAGPRGDSVE